MESNAEMLLLLCHHGDWEHRYQASAAAAAAATAGRQVRLVLFFGALEAMAAGGWDRVPEGDIHYRGIPLAERVEEVGVSSPGELLAAARRSGRCKVLACSASLSIVGYSPADLGEMIDEVVGWPTILQLMQPASQVLYL